jgi:lambda family phage tail tape measure protein
MANENINIIITEKGGKTVQRTIKDIGTSASGSASAVDGLKSALGLLGGALSVRELIRMADTYTNIQNRLKLVTTDTQNLAAVTNELFQIANNTRSSFEGTAELYSRVGLAAKDLGVSQKQLLEFTESLNQAVILSGASAAEASAGIIQLSQGLASGALRGDELRSVLEQLPMVADVIAKELKITRGELRFMGEQGKITADIVLKAFKNAREELGDKFAKTVPTIGQAFTILNNSVIKYVGSLSTAYNVTGRLAELIIKFATNLDQVASAVAVFAAAFAPVFAGAIMLRAISLTTAFFVLVNANPFMAILGALSAIVVAYGQYNDQLNDNVKAMNLNVNAIDKLVATWHGLQAAVGEIVGNMKNILSELPEIFGNIAIKSAQLFLDGLALMLNTGEKLIVGWVNEISESLNMGKILEQGDPIKFELPTLDIPKTEKAAADAAKAFNDAYVDSLIIASARNNKGAAGAISDIAGQAVKLKNTKPDKELEKLKNALAGVIAEANPMWAATQRLSEAQTILDKSVKRGLISQQEAINVMGQLTEKYKDQLDPLGAVNRELNQSLALLKMSADARAVESDMIQTTQRLQEAGLTLNDKELAQLRERLLLIQEQNRITQQKDQIYSDVVQPQIDLQAGQKAIEQLKTEFPQYIDQFNQKLLDLRYAALQGSTDMYDGFERGFIQIQKTLTDTAALSEQLVTQSFSAAEDAVVGFVKTGKFSLNDFSDMFLEMTTRMLTRWLMMQALGIFTGGAGGGGGAVGQAAELFGPGFATGGEFMVGGSGGTDSQQVAFRATPNESVEIKTPQQRRDEENNRSGGDVQVPVSIINVTDPRAAVNAMKTSEGQRVILNTIQQNPAIVRKILGG